MAKLYTEDLRIGQDYERLRRCIDISILDFELVKGAKYHNVYRLCNRDGSELTDLLEIHMIELVKCLEGTGPIDDWIRLFNAQDEEDLKIVASGRTGNGSAKHIRFQAYNRIKRMIPLSKIYYKIIIKHRIPPLTNAEK